VESSNIILPYVLSGISVGGQYALIAIGYTMVYGILRLINFAHADVFMVAGLIMINLWPLLIGSSLPLWLALALAILLVVILTMSLSFCIEQAAYKPLRAAPRMSIMVSAIGISIFLQSTALYITGGLAENYPSIPWISDPITFLGEPIRRVTLITPILVAVLVFALIMLINHTKIGVATRAVAKDFETSRLMGIKVDPVISMTFAIGSFLAAIGSMLFFSNFAMVTPVVGAMPGLKAFVAAVFGGIGSIPGAVLGGVLIGVCESLIKGLDTILLSYGIIKTPLELSTFSDAFTFVLLIVILVFKPTGLFGEKATDKV
jgi:branched-chain amino acid transport system permease protein